MPDMSQVKFNAGGAIGSNVVATMTMNDDDSPASITVDCEALRDEGRRQILREIAALPMTDDQGPLFDSCYFCRSDEIQPIGSVFGGPAPVVHKPDCLWMRAQALK